jgi:hypothetical protein
MVKALPDVEPIETALIPYTSVIVFHFIRKIQITTRDIVAVQGLSGLNE